MENNWKQIKKLLEILGSKTRVEILRLLSDRQCYVSEISRELDIGQQSVLRHLKLLEEFKFLDSFDEIIDTETRGRGRRRKYYSISEDFPFSMLISFNEDTFNILLQQNQEVEKERKSQIDLLESWPAIKFYENEINRIKNIKDNVDKLKFVIDLIKRLEDEFHKHQIAMQYMNRLLNELEKFKEKIKDTI